MKHLLLPFTFLLLFFFTIGNTTAQSFEWAKKMGGLYSEYGKSITVDFSGNIYIAGRFNEIADFDPGIGTYNLTAKGSLGNFDIFVCKLDASGNFLWAKSMGGPGADEVNAITVDKLGNVYLTGFFRNTADFDPDTGTFNLTSSGAYDIFVTKLSSAGNFLWAKRMGGSQFDEGRSISLDRVGNVYITGRFQDTADFDPGIGVFNLISNGHDEIFVSKLDSSGNFLWAKSMGGDNEDYGNSIAVDTSGNVFTTGFFKDTTDFDPGIGTFNLVATNADIFISKLDSSGNFLWAKKMGGLGFNTGNLITLDKYGNVYTSGDFGDTVDFNPGMGVYNLISEKYNLNVFVSKLSSSGNFLWAKDFGVKNRLGGVGVNSIAIDKLGAIYLAGGFGDTIDFDPGVGTFYLTGFGYSDAFICKLDSLGNFLWANQIGGSNQEAVKSISLDTSGNIYTTGVFKGTVDFNPNTGVFNLTATRFDDIFVSKWSQCFIDTSLSTNLQTLMANQQGASYQWLNCDSSFQAISWATGLIFTPAINGSYACEISLNGCVDTTACVQVIVTGIEKNAFSEEYKIYPNPFADQLTIESVGVHLNTQVEVINIKGQVVYETTTLLNGKTVLNTADWSKGIYIIRLTNEQGVGTYKLVHQ